MAPRTLGVPASCRASDVALPFGPLAHRDDRAAALQVGLRGRQPVAPPDQHPRAEGRVQLVAGERHVVEVERGDVQRPVRHELGGVHRDPRAVPVGDVGQPGDRPQLPGDVGRGRDHQQRGPSIAASASSAARSASPGKAGGASRTGADQGEEGGMVLGVEDHHRGPSGRLRASRFMASVVLRVNTSASSVPARTNALIVCRACS